MRGILRAPSLWTAVVLVALACGPVTTPVTAGDGLKPERPATEGQVGTLADLGERALERLPWDVHIVRANLSARRPMAVAGAYLMQDDLLIVSQTGLVYPMAREDLSVRWVNSLKGPLAAVPGEGPSEYVFLVKAQNSYWIHAFSKRSGAELDRFPVQLPFAATGGVDSDGSRVYVGSLGSPGHNRILEEISLADGRRGAGRTAPGLLWAAPQVDPSNASLILACENGVILSMGTGLNAPEEPLWRQKIPGAISATPVVTPAQVVVGSQDGLFRGIDLATGEVLWLEGTDAPIKVRPWVLGQNTVSRRSAGVEGAPPIEVEVYSGIAFAKNRAGLSAFDLQTGAPLFREKDGRKPVARYGRWVVTLNEHCNAVFRDMESNYGVVDRLPLQMFDLIPTNTSGGAIYGVTHDGGIVAAIPKKN
jgi:hypothetical protein